MNVLLDTCTLLALAGGELPDGAATALRKAPEAYVFWRARDRAPRVVSPGATGKGQHQLTRFTTGCLPAGSSFVIPNG
jgi:hypothetical protein